MNRQFIYCSALFFFIISFVFHAFPFIITNLNKFVIIFSIAYFLICNQFFKAHVIIQYGKIIKRDSVRSSSLYKISSQLFMSILLYGIMTSICRADLNQNIQFQKLSIWHLRWIQMTKKFHLQKSFSAMRHIRCPHIFDVMLTP